ncbi:MAG: hypothetical protein JO325_03490 [Solirubrobacterales bacterium]|nr:hypothetical protein [Solirubrobacterales bacterium]
MHRYRALLALPGARAPMLLSIAGTIPIGMFGLAVLLLARDATGSRAHPGRVLGTFSLATAFGSVAQGRLMDRVGQGLVLRAIAIRHLPTLVLLVLAAHEDATGWLLAVIAVCGGSTVPQLPAPMRSLWSMLADRGEQRETAYATVAIAFEISVVTAPLARDAP